MPSLDSSKLEQVSKLVSDYIWRQRGHFRPQCNPLSDAQQASMAGFFSLDLLHDVTICIVKGRIPNPDFYPMIEQMGFNDLPNFTAMAAITFSDVVVAQQRFSDGLLFHELVHVEQYRQLGINQFAALYIRGFLNGGGYDGIPLEMNAYSLEERFRRNPKQPFSVREEVARWVSEKRF